MKIAICGSMSASVQMCEIEKFLTANGHKVFLPKNTEKYANGDLQSETNHESAEHKIHGDLIRGYFDIINNSDAVVVANYEKNGIKNYVGGNSFLEAGFAHVLNKKLYFINDIPEIMYKDELVAMQPIIIYGDLSKLLCLNHLN